MRSRLAIVIASILAIFVFTNPSIALTTAPQIAQDKDSGYDRSFFKHWIDGDKDGDACE